MLIFHLTNQHKIHFFAYGFELIKDYTPYLYSKKYELITDIDFRNLLKEIYNASANDLIQWKKEAQLNIKLFKNGKIQEDVLLKWLEDNK